VRISRRWFAVLPLVLSVMLLTGSPRAMAQGDPVAFINQLGTQAIQVLGPKTPAPARLQRFRELFASDFDLPGIAQFVLGRYWRVATPEQQQQFMGLLQEYLAQAYSGRLAEYAGEPFHALSARADGDQTIVNSEIIRNDGGKIRVDWYLVNRGGWKISDAYVAGVSMRVTQRDEFGSVIQQGGGQVQYLIDRLRQKVGG
jgi:phospholipid transport system substrate-binding protein